MAIANTLPGVEVTVNVDGQPLREYVDRTEDPVDGIAVSYIEAMSGKNFTVTVAVSDDAVLDGDSVSVDIPTDGWRADGFVVFKPSVGEWPNAWTSSGIRTSSRCRITRDPGRA